MGLQGSHELHELHGLHGPHGLAQNVHLLIPLLVLFRLPLLCYALQGSGHNLQELQVFNLH